MKVIVCFKRNDKTFIPFPISFDCNVATIDSIPLCVIQSIISKEYAKKIFCKDVWSVLVINSGLIFSVVFKADSQPVAAYLHKIYIESGK